MSYYFVPALVRLLHQKIPMLIPAGYGHRYRRGKISFVLRLTAFRDYQNAPEVVQHAKRLRTAASGIHLHLSSIPCNCCGHGSYNPLQQIVQAKTRGIFGTKKIQPPCNIIQEGAVIFGELEEALSLHKVVQPQVVDSASEPEISEQRSRHVHVRAEPSFMHNRYNVSRMHEQPRLQRCVKRENLRFSIGQTDARQYHTGSHEGRN